MGTLGHIRVMASFKICHRPSVILKSFITSETMLDHDPKIYNLHIRFCTNKVPCATSATSPAYFGTIIYTFILPFLQLAKCILASFPS